MKSAARNARLRGRLLASFMLAGAMALQACVQRDVITVTVGTVTVSPRSTSIRVGDTIAYEATVSDSEGRTLSRAPVEWISESPEFFAIDTDGTGVGVAPGSSVIRATFRGVTGTGIVTVIPAPQLSITPDSAIFYGAAGAPSPSPIALIVGGDALTGLTVDITYDAGEPADWLTANLGSTRAPTALTLTPLSETLPVGSYNATVAVSSPDDRRGPLFIPVQLILTGFSVTETGGTSIVGESGPSDSLLVVLDASPTSDVVLDVTSADPTEVSASPSALTFTPANWNVPQVVVLTGEDEFVSDGDQLTDVAISVNVDASDAAFDPIPARTTSVTTVDNDVPSFTITATDGSSSVNESGTSDLFTVVLDVEPLTPVTLNVSWSDSTEVAAGPSTLTFTPSDWATPQTVTLTGVDDPILDGNQSTDVFVSVIAAASDDAFDALAPGTTTVTTVDDDVAQFTVREIGALIGGVDSTVVTEAGSSDQFTIVLEAQPGSDVVMSIVSSDPGEATVSPAVVVFNSGNWNAPAVVTVTGVDDALLDGDQGTPVTISVDDANSDDPFDGLPDVVIGVLTEDDDVADIVIVESGGNTTVTEAGSTDAFTVALGAQPLTSVVLDITSGDTGEATVSTPSLTFTTDDWDTPQSVTVTGIDEFIDDGDQVTTVTVSVNDAASDDDFDALPDESVAVTTIDDDAAGFTITETDGGTLVTEAGSTDDVTIVLNSEPIDDVVLTLFASDGGEASVAPTSLTFTSATWDQEQTVTITGVNDLEDDGDQFSVIAVAVSEALSDAAYDPVPDQTIQVTTTDDDAPAGFTVTAIGGTLVTEAGGTDNFSVRLDTEPVGTVVIDIATSDAGEAIVAPATLTFTAANWTVTQTVTVTGVDDNLIDGTQSTTITVSVNDAASDDNFDPLADQTLIAETSDDDVAGIITVESDGTTVVSEGGSTDSFTVALTAQPFSDVVISVASSDLGEVTVSPPTLTFTPTDWNTPQPVTVTGEDDPVIDGGQLTLVTLAIVDASSDDNFDPVADQTVSVQTTDNDQPGISVAESGGTTLVTEAGGTDDFTVVLDSEPSSNVVLDIVSLDTGEATVIPATLTFTPTNWDTPRSVVVTGVDDALIDGDIETTISVSVDDATSDDAYDPVPDATLTVTTTDDDGAGFTVTESGGATLVSEDGTTDDITVVLSAQPASAVRLDIDLSDPSEASANPVQLTFTGATWNTPQTVTITGVDDALTDGSQVSTLTVSVNVAGSDDAYDLLADQTVTVTTSDNDIASFVVLETGGGTLVSESGGQDDFSIVLGTQPTTDVVLDLLGSDIGEAALSPTTLTFTSVNWNVAQIVTVTGVNDAVIDGNQSSTATISVNPLSDADFAGLPPQVVTITTTDDDAAGVSVTETDNATLVTEAGSIDSINVVLTSEPASDVVVDVLSANTLEVTVAPTRLTFTPADWSVTQTVVVTGVNELIDDGNQTTLVSIAVDDAASDDEYDVITDQVVNVTTVDDDVAGFTVTELDGATLVSEAGLTDDLSVVLDTEPVANVVLTVTANDATEATASPISLVFTPADWSTPQTVTVTGVDDFIDDGDINSTITIAVDAPGSDDAFDSVLPEVVTVTTTDNDAPVGITVTAIGGTTVTEAGGADDFTVVLDAQPGTNVVLTVTSADAGEVSVLPATLTFTNGNWNTPQTVTVTGVDDDIIDGTQITTVTVAVDDALSDDAYDPAADETVDVNTADDDVAGFTLGESAGSTVVNESGTIDSVTVVLDAEPSAAGVVITVTSGNPLEATVAPASLTFTPANWDTPQSITVTGVDDLVIDFNQVTALTFAVDDAASDDDFDGLADQTVNATTTDDDAAGISISASGGSTVVTEAGSTDNFTVALNRGPASDVVINVSSGDIGEATVSPAVLTFTPANWSTPQTVTVTGVNDAGVDGDQVTTITIAVDDALSDDTYDGISETLSVTTTDDDSPGMTVVESGPGTSVSESGTTDDITVVLTAQPSTAVSLTLGSADTGEVSVFPATLTFTNANWNTPQTATLTGVDDDLIDGNASTTVTIAVDAASSAPEYSAVADETVIVTTLDDDAATFSIVESGAGTLVTEAGSTDEFTVVLGSEPASPVVFDVTASTPTEATASPLTLTFTAANWDTPQTVTVTGVDDVVIDGNASSTVTISVDPAASDDDFDLLAAQQVNVITTDDDAGGFTLEETAGTTVVTEAGLSDTFTAVLTSQPASNVVFDVTSADTDEVTVSPATLTFTPANWDTPQIVTVTGVDDLVDDGATATSISVAVNDAASDDDFDALPDQIVSVTNNDDDTAGITAVETGGGTLVTEAGSTDDFTVVLDTEPLTDVVIDVSSSDLGEATVAPLTLTFTPANWNVPQTVTVTGVDDLIDDDSQFTVLSLTVEDAVSDDAYDSVLPRTITVTTTDDDAAVGMTVTAIGITTVTEAGGTDDFTVVLTAQPGTDVVVDVTSGDLGEVTALPSPLTFTPANWNTPQTVTVTGVDDDILDGNQITQITVAVDAANSDDAYDLVADETVDVTTTDDDVAGFTVVESGGSTVVNESGTTDDITVVLDAEPSAAGVVINVATSDAGEATVSAPSLTFTAANWDTPQTVTVTGVDDLDIDLNQSTNITFSIDQAASDDDFDGLADQTVVATTTDNDAAGLTITASDGSTIVTEAGSTDDFTVVLSSGPASNVIVTVTSGDIGEATVAPTTLTFTPANWFTAQTVTVTGVDDAGVDGDQVTTITVAVDDALSDDAYDGISEVLSATTTDDDGAGIAIDESGGSTDVSEPATTDGFSIVLLAQPATNVVLNLTSDDTGEAVVSPAFVTFTNANWNTPQVVTVTAVDDDLVDGPQTATVTISVDALLSDDEYDGVPDGTVSVTTTDDDVAAITIVETDGGTIVTEAGGTDVFTVVLETEPLVDVVLDVTASDLGEATVSPAQLTFTSADWDTPQTVTVTGVDDAIIDGSQLSQITIAVDDVASDDSYDGVLDVTVSVTTNDDDGAAFSVTETDGNTFVSEAGGTDDFTVVLGAEPASDVVFDLAVSDATEASLSAASLTFTPANWATPQTVTVTGVDDFIDDGSIVSTVTISVNDAASDDAFDPLLDQTVTVTTTDDDEAGFTVVTGPSTVTEAGSTASFSVVLDAQPVSNVAFTITSGDVSEVTVAPATLTFTPADWNVAQVVTLTGVDDLENDGPVLTSITIAVNDGLSDDTFDPLPNQTVQITTLDDDQAGFTITQTGGGTTVNESGTTDDFSVVLTAAPVSDVTLLVTSGDLSEVTVAPGSLVFTSANWNTPQVVTVTGVDDAFDDGDRFTLVTVSVDDANSDDAYDPLADQSVSVSTIDDDGVGFTVTQSDGNSIVTEAGGTDDFTVVLDAQPLTDVVLDVTSADPGEVTAAPTALTFTSANWDTPQTVTLTGVDDAIDDGDVLTLVTVSVDAASSDDAYDAVTPQNVGVTTIDDDDAGFTLAGTPSVTEAGSTDTFTAVLDVPPTSDVVLTVTSGDVGEATVAPASLTFTTANWNVAQTVTVTGVDDLIADGDVVVTITVAVDDASSDDAFDPLADQTVSSTTVDDDTAGFAIAESDGSTVVSEAGTTDTFTAVLLTQPTSNVVLDISSGDVGEATVNVSSLNFTTANWNTPQTVTVTGVNDALADGDQSTTVTITVNDGASDDAFDAVADQTVTVTTTDDDTAGFTIVESGGTTSVNESGTTDEFTVALTAQPTTDVVLVVGSLDTDEVTSAPLTLTFTSANWSTPQPVTVTGVDDAIVDGPQTTGVLITVDDANSDDAFDPVADQTVDVTTVDNDAPDFSVTESGGSTIVSEAGGTDTFDVVLTAEPGSNVVFDLTSADPGEATLSSAQLTFTTANWSTPQTVTVTGVDDAIQDGPQVTVLTISVDAALSDDSFDAIPAKTVNATTTDDDAAQYTVSETDGSTIVAETGTTDLISVVLGLAPASDVVVTATSNDTDEVTVFPATLTFTPANWDTPQNFTVTGADDATIDGSQITVVTIAIDDANSDDAFDPLADQSVNVTTTDDDVGAFSLSAGTVSVTEGGSTDDFTVVLDRQPLTNVVFEITSGDPGEAAVSPALMTFTAANWDTPQTVTVTGVDDAIQDGSQSTTITVAVSAPNSDDAFDALPSQQVLATTTDDDTAGFTFVESGGNTTVDESGTTDVFTIELTAQPTSAVVIDVTSNDTGEATLLPTQVTFTPADWNFPRTIVVTGIDDTVLDGSVVSTITLSINDAASDDAFDPLADQTVSVTTTDDDVPGFTVTETGSTSVSEAGTTDNFTVVLDAEPASDVVFTVVSSDPAEAVVDLGTLTFTPATWDTPQTVTVTGVDDFIVDGEQTSTITISVDDANSNDSFDPLADQTVTVTTLDDDGAGFTLAQSGGGTVVFETGTTDDFTVVLTAEPESDVVLTVTSADLSEATVDVASLTFTPLNWDTPQTVTVTGIDDLNDDGNQVTAVTISVDAVNSADGYDLVPDQIAFVTTIDNDVAGFTIEQSGSGTLVSETGTTDSMTVVLTSEPVDDVVILVGSEDVTEMIVDAASLTFTSANWTTPQTIEVTGVDDMLLDGVQFTLIRFSIDDATSDDAYDPVANQFVSVTVTDDDGAAYTVTETDGNTTVDESGTPTDEFTIVLDAQPFGDVVFDVSSSDTGEAVVSPTTVTFNNGDWDQPHTVTVTGVDDSVIDGPQSATVTISVNTAATENSFDAMPNQTVDVTITDDDVPGFTFVESAGFTSVTEGGSTDDFTVVLDVQPAGPVVIDVSSPDMGEVTVTPSTLTFTTINWGTPQTVTVTGVDDDLDDGDQVTLIDLSINTAATDDAFDAVASQSVPTATVDNDAAGFTVVESAGSTSVTEAGSSDSFTVRLDAQPLTAVTIDITNPDGGEVDVTPTSLTFTTLNWNVTQTVTAMGIDDNVADGDQPTSLTLSVNDALSDDIFDDVIDQAVVVTTTDDDVASFSITETAGNTVVDESGSTDTFTVSIAAEPVTAVVIDITSGDVGEATVSPAQLTFTSANWNVPQTVTVTGVDDGSLVDGDDPTTITVSINQAGSDGTYDFLVDQQLTVTTLDLDVAGYSVSETTATVGETVGNDNFTVVLTAQPVSDVVFDVTSADTGEATVTPGQLTFTNANWNIAQTVTVSGVDDAPQLDGDQTTIVTVGINQIGSNTAFDGLADETVSVTTTDEQLPGMTLTESGASSVVSETGTTDDFTVVLDAQPLSNVRLIVASADAGEVTVSPASLTFTFGNWNVPQTVTLTGVGDSPLLDGDQITVVSVTVDAANSYDLYDALGSETISVTTTDANAPGLDIDESGGTTSVDETGTTDDFTVALTAEPTSNVVLTVVSGDTDNVTVSPATLTFTPANYDTPQTVTVTGVDDGVLVDGLQTVPVTLSVVDASSDDLYDPIADESVSVASTDDDTAAFTVTESGGGTTVAEDGGGNTDGFTVVLDAQPASNVVITISSGSPGEAQATPTSLTFTTSTWSVAQAVTVTGQNDSPLVDGSQQSTVTVAVDAANSDDAWDGLASQPVTVTTTDTDVAGFSVTPSGGVTTVTEASGGSNTDDFTIVLTAQPDGPVVFTVTSDDTGEATASPASVAFNNGNWNAPQTVTVTGVDDDIIDGDQSTNITVSINQGATTALFDALGDEVVSATTIDDDVAGFTVTQSGGTTVTEAAGVNNTDDFTVVLDIEPASNVVISVTAGTPAEATAAPTPLTFTTANWNTPQTVTVTGVDDDVDDGNQVSVITLAVVDASSDDAFDPLANQTVNVTTVDDDVAGITVTPTSGLTTSEDTDTATFDVVLDSEPIADVTISLSSSDAGEGTVTATPLTFTSLDWDTPQTVSVVGVDDGAVDGDVVYTIITAPAVSADPDYSGLNASDVTVTNTDNDGAAIVVTLGGPGVVVSETGTSTTFDVELDTAPASNVVVDIVSSDTGEATVGSASLIFTSGNWNTPQTVTVTGVDDVFADGDIASTITVSVDTGASDPLYSLTGDETVSVTSTDDEVAGFTVTESGGDTVTNEDGLLQTFLVVLDERPETDVVITITNPDPTEITVNFATLIFTTANWAAVRTVEVRGVNDSPDNDGDTVTTIVVSIDDALSPAPFDALPDVPIEATNTDLDPR